MYVAILRLADSPSKEIYRLSTLARLRNWNETNLFTDALCSIRSKYWLIFSLKLRHSVFCEVRNGLLNIIYIRRITVNAQYLTKTLYTILSTVRLEEGCKSVFATYQIQNCNLQLSHFNHMTWSVAAGERRKLRMRECLKRAFLMCTYD
jgi:hypothetical protein